ncbi:YeeE/YedE family protein [Paracoccus sp. S-4012]|uniref:YeeE/YedE family protein n=1 Tax=Paracoccus sp. S-4012 TaxID=2665648 RepID=UPI0012B11957|nr:YeeE/YedE family protein [Paracoccus sp. S-4012]MRX51217.1 YeeE/YedE family protein [Paracoccus sp. S-4012]
MDVALQLVLVGLLCGVLLGGASRVTDFCTLGALETAMLGRDFRRLHIWAVALGTAILATQIGVGMGLVNRGGTVYHAVIWNPVASISGGLVFGYGMALAGNCGFGAALRAGAGDIRSIILLGVIGVSAYATLSGPLAPIRAGLFPQWEQTSPNGMDVTFNALTGLPPALLGLALGAGLIWQGMRHPRLSGSLAAAGGAMGVGLAVALSLIGTSVLQDWSVSAIYVEGPSFTAPVGRSILYVMTATGTVPGYSVGMVFGTMLGAFLVCWLRGEFHWEACDDARELGRMLCGAVLMGVGGAVAIGCTIGQGLTATATLAWSGPVTLVAICAGAYVGLQRLVAQPDG